MHVLVFASSLWCTTSRLSAMLIFLDRRVWNVAKKRFRRREYGPYSVLLVIGNYSPACQYTNV